MGNKIMTKVACQSLEEMVFSLIRDIDTNDHPFRRKQS